MTDLGPLFDTGERRKAEGMALADAAEPGFWKDRADAAIKALAAEGREFTAEDVRKRAGDPSRPNAMGARFSAAATAGLIRYVKHQKSTRPSLHACKVAVWVGKKNQGEG